MARVNGTGAKTIAKGQKYVDALAIGRQSLGVGDPWDPLSLSDEHLAAGDESPALRGQEESAAALGGLESRG